MIQSAKDYLTFLTVGAFVTVLLCAPVACVMHEDHKIAEMVKAGANPTAARCAIRGASGESPVCLIHAAQGN